MLVTSNSETGSRRAGDGPHLGLLPLPSHLVQLDIHPRLLARERLVQVQGGQDVFYLFGHVFLRRLFSSVSCGSSGDIEPDVRNSASQRSSSSPGKMGIAASST